MGLLAAIGTPYIPGWPELRPFIAELWLIGTVVGVLIAPFFVKKPNVASGVVALAGLSAALVSLLAVGPNVSASGAFSGLLVADPTAFFWKILLLLFVIGIVMLWFATTRHDMREGDGPEFFTLLLGATCGMAFMASANHLVMIFLAIELASFPSYVLAGFRKTHKVAAEASLKYVLFGASASAVMVYGMSLLYGQFATLNLAELAAAMSQANASAVTVVGVAGLIVGMGFKISAVPFHFWCPDVFEGAHVDVSAFLSVASKGAALVLLLRVVMAFAQARQFLPGETAMASPMVLAIVLGVMGALSATVGNTAAFVQTNIKRLLAYSSIAHAGYMLCALSLMVRAGGLDSPADVTPAVLLFYLAVYLFMNLGAFSVAAMVQRQSGSETLEGLNGLGRRNPVAAACMAACLFSLVGLPPLAGFNAKFNVLVALMQGGTWWWALVAVIVINTVLSLYVYARIIRAMYLRSSDEPAFVGPPLGMALSMLCSVMLVLMFIGAGPLTRLTQSYGQLQSVVRPMSGDAVSSGVTSDLATR